MSSSVKVAVKNALRPTWRALQRGKAKLLGKDPIPHAVKKKSLDAAKVRRKQGGINVSFIPYGKSGIQIAVAEPVISQFVKEKITLGHYEVKEAKMAASIMVENEIVLELGAGVGLISTIVGKTGKAREIHCFEADQRLLPLIHETHVINQVAGVSLYNEAITSDPESLKRGYIEFHLREAFWGSSTNGAVGKEVKEAVRVKTRKFSDIVQLIRPTIIIADIEGAEMGLFANVDMSSVKTVLVEVHPHIIGPNGMRGVFDDLHRAGFYYDPKLSMGSVPGFTRG
jgi:FkbM family methyltransferase